MNPGPVFHVVCLAYNLKLGKRSIYLSLIPQLIFTVVQPHKTSFYLEEEKKKHFIPLLKLGKWQPICVLGLGEQMECVLKYMVFLMNALRTQIKH